MLIPQNMKEKNSTPNLPPQFYNKKKTEQNAQNSDSDLDFIPTMYGTDPIFIHITKIYKSKNKLLPYITATVTMQL